MSIDQVIDLFQGDEASKREFKLAYQQAFKFKIKVFSCLFILFSLAAFFTLPSDYVPSQPFLIRLIDQYGFIFFAFIPALVFSMFIGNYYLQYLTRHLKITLPENIAPKIEFRSE